MDILLNFSAELALGSLAWRVPRGRTSAFECILACHQPRPAPDQARFVFKWITTLFWAIVKWHRTTCYVCINATARYLQTFVRYGICREYANKVAVATMLTPGTIDVPAAHKQRT